MDIDDRPKGDAKMEDRNRRVLELLEAHGTQLYALLARITLRDDVAEDLLQDLAMRLQAARGFAQAANPAAYAVRAATHLAFDWRKQCKRRRERPLPSAELAAGDPSPVSRLAQDEQVRLVLEAAGKLPRLCREAFVMRLIQQMPYDTIGKELGKTAHQVRALCHKAVKGVRKRLGEHRRQGE